jgi:hypothetical protein
MSKTDEALKRFLAAPKPAWCIPADVAVMAVLIACQNEPYPGHPAVSNRAGLSAVDVKSAMRALKRLEAAGWIVPKDEGGYRIEPDKLPKGQ